MFFFVNKTNGEIIWGKTMKSISDYVNIPKDTLRDKIRRYNFYEGKNYILCRGMIEVKCNRKVLTKNTFKERYAAMKAAREGK